MHSQLPLIQKLRGITMVENLVALLVLSVGLLGLAGLQASTLRNSTDSGHRSVAVQQARAMANRIRANTAGVVSGDYNAVGFSAPTPAVLCDAAACTPSQLATFDAYEWNTANADLLPGGGGTVTGVATGVATPPTLPASTQFTIRVFWDADRTGASGLGCDPANANDLKCIQLQVVAP